MVNIKFSGSVFLSEVYRNSRSKDYHAVLHFGACSGESTRGATSELNILISEREYGDMKKALESSKGVASGLYLDGELEIKVKKFVADLQERFKFV